MIKTELLFDNWNEVKKKIEFSKKINIKNPKIGEFWICKIGVNIGNEVSKDQEFQRPVLVLSNNLGGDLVGILPMTTKFKENFSRYYYKVENYLNYGLNMETYILLNNFKVISSKRLIKKINNIHVNGKYIIKYEKENLSKIKELMKKLYKL